MTTLRALASILPLALFACAGALAAAVPASGRLTLDIRIEGSGSTRGVQGRTTIKTAQSARLALTVHPLAGLEAINRLDQAAYQADLTQHATLVETRIPPITLSAGAPRMAGQMQEAAACGSNLACLQGVRGAAAAAATQEAGEGRYLNFTGLQPEQCRLEYTARINDSVDGSIDAAGGPVPYSERRQADYRGGERDAVFVCQSMVTLDVKTDRLWVAVQPPAPRGQVTRLHGRRRETASPGEGLALQRDALSWVFDQLRGKVGRAGSSTTTLRLPVSVMGQPGEQVVDVDLRWKFETK